MLGRPAANYKTIPRFLQHADPKRALLRLFQADAPFVIADPTEMPRPQARKTPYVGTLSDGHTRGFWLLVLAPPFRGRAIPFSFVTYSSATLAQPGDSRNINHWRALDEIKPLIGDKPLVLDREFSYWEQWKYLVANQIHFVIRLHLGSHPPTLVDRQGNRVHLWVRPGTRAVYRHVLYKGQVAVNIGGTWRQGAAEPLWVMTDLQPERGVELYHGRRKIEQSFRDLKSLLGMEKLMNKSQQPMEQMVAMLLLAYPVGILTGETIRDALSGARPIERLEERGVTESLPPAEPSRTWRLYSGLFILLKQRLSLSLTQLRQLVAQAQALFAQMVLPPVRT